jgi:hypothetical protein
MLRARMRELLGDAIVVVPIIFALPLAILAIGTPIALFVQLLIDIVAWI